MITFTHPFNMLAKFLGGVVGIAAMAGTILLLDLTPYGPERIVHNKELAFIAPITWFVLGFGFVLASRQFLYKPYLVPAANWLFLAVERKTKIPWRDCVRLSPLFVEGKDFSWYDAKDLQSIPESERLDHLYTIAAASGRLKPPSDSVELGQDYRRQNSAQAKIEHEQPAESDQQENPQKQDRIPNRGVGIFALAGSFVLGCLFVISPLIDASRHAESVELHLTATVMVPVCFIIGLAQTILGDKSERILGLMRGQKTTPLGWALMIASFGIGTLLYFCLKATLRAYGYG
jgi:hypothetical protein